MLLLVGSQWSRSRLCCCSRPNALRLLLRFPSDLLLLLLLALVDDSPSSNDMPRWGVSVLVSRGELPTNSRVRSR
jgi:hypothetical protein